MTTPEPFPPCPACNGPTRQATAARFRASQAFVYRCATCGHRHGRLDLSADDGDEVHTFVRRQLAKMLKPPKPNAVRKSR